MKLELPGPVVAIVCVTMISAGQLLFRQTSLAIERRGAWLDGEVLLLLGIALLTYGLATLLWIHLLRSMPLSAAYPFMGLSFVLVPLLGVLVFQESISLNQALGAGLILAGVSLSSL
jgi:drug/metabolite transporter (DMT)-like permease